jgi:hypothetical protein
MGLAYSIVKALCHYLLFNSKKNYSIIKIINGYLEITKKVQERESMIISARRSSLS